MRRKTEVRKRKVPTFTAEHRAAMPLTVAKALALSDIRERVQARCGEHRVLDRFATPVTWLRWRYLRQKVSISNLEQI